MSRQASGPLPRTGLRKIRLQTVAEIDEHVERDGRQGKPINLRSAADVPTCEIHHALAAIQTSLVIAEPTHVTNFQTWC